MVAARRVDVRMVYTDDRRCWCTQNRPRQRSSIQRSLSRLWSAVPPTKGGTTDGQSTVHRCAGSPLSIPGCDRCDAQGVSPVRPTFRVGVPRASRRVVPRWEAAAHPPVHGRLCGMGQTTAHPRMHVLLPVLLVALRTLGDAPARSLTALAQRLGGAETDAATVVAPLEEEPAPNAPPCAYMPCSSSSF